MMLMTMIPPDDDDDEDFVLPKKKQKAEDLKALFQRSSLTNYTFNIQVMLCSFVSFDVFT